MRGEKLAQELHKSGITHLPILEAIASIPRENFVPGGFEKYAYSLDALPIQGSQWISSPLTVAKMTQALDLENADSILEIGCGSGYQAAVLAKLVRRVFTIERIERLLIQARQTFKTLRLTNINTRLGDGQHGWKQFAPFDRILFSASPDHIPQALIDQLSEGGILVAPMLKGNEQIITRFVKRGVHFKGQEIESCRFVPVIDGIENL